VQKISPLGLELVEISVKTVLPVSPDSIQMPTKQQCVSLSYLQLNLQASPDVVAFKPGKCIWACSADVNPFVCMFAP
jgi:hypothetical protein